MLSLSRLGGGALEPQGRQEVGLSKGSNKLINKTPRISIPRGPWIITGFIGEEAQQGATGGRRPPGSTTPRLLVGLVNNPGYSGFLQLKKNTSHLLTFYQLPEYPGRTVPRSVSLLGRYHRRPTGGQQNWHRSQHHVSVFMTITDVLIKSSVRLYFHTFPKVLSKFSTCSGDKCLEVFLFPSLFYINKRLIRTLLLGSSWT